MKHTSIIACLSLCALPFAFAEEALPETHGPVIELIDPHHVQPHVQLELQKAPAPKPQTEAIPKKYAEEKAVAIKVEDLRNIGERLYMQASLRIINPTDQPIVFTGFSETNPLTKIQHWVDGKWVDEEKILRCGTGLRQCTIAPGQSAVFKAGVHPETMPSRFGIAYTLANGKAQFVVWSEKIER